jgi:hypothetical protein
MLLCSRGSGVWSGNPNPTRFLARVHCDVHILYALIFCTKVLIALRSRFSQLSVAETQPVLFCTEKQQTDKKIMAGTEHKVPKATSHHGNPVYFDPHDNELAVVQHYRKQHLQEERRKREAQEFQRLLKTIPKVDYFPTTRLAEMYAKSGVLDTFAGGNSSSTIIGAELGGGDGGYEQASPGATAQEAGHDGGGSRSLGVGGGSTYSSILQVPVRVCYVWFPLAA